MRCTYNKFVVKDLLLDFINLTIDNDEDNGTPTSKFFLLLL